MNIAGYILAGGDNRRMDGRKKIYLHRDGKTFGQWICEAFSGLSGIYLSVAKLPEDSVSGVRNEYGLSFRKSVTATAISAPWVGSPPA